MQDPESVRQRKHNHNMIERRRRYNINDKIKELGDLLPKGSEQFNEVVQGAKMNKGTILKFSVDYVRCLKKEVKRLNGVEEKCAKIEKNSKKMIERIKVRSSEGKIHFFSFILILQSLEHQVQSLQESHAKSQRVYLQHREQTLQRSCLQPPLAIPMTQQHSHNVALPAQHESQIQHHESSTVDFSAVLTEVSGTEATECYFWDNLV